MKKIIFTLALSLSFFNFSLAAQDDGIYTYLFHLYFDNGKLVKDRDFEAPFDLIAEDYVLEKVESQTALWGEVLAIGGRNEATFQFNPRQGKMTVKAPYFPDADRVNFYNLQGEKLLTILVRGSSVCNNNGVCESDVGENQKNCSADCKSVYPAPSLSAAPSPSFLKQIDSRWLMAAGGAAGLAVIILGFWFWKKRKNKDALPPPQIH